MVTFAEKFCEHYHVAPERYADAMLWRCLHRRAWLLLPFVRLVGGEYFSADYDLVKGVGRLRSVAGLADELDNYYSHTDNHGFMRRRLCLRISIGRVSTLVQALLPGGSRRPRLLDSRPSL